MESLEPSNNYFCYICNTNVAKALTQEHITSKKHQDYTRIHNEVFERMSKHLNIGTLTTLNRSIPENVYYCENCCQMIAKNDKNIHETSEYHQNMIKNDKIVDDFAKIFTKSDCNIFDSDTNVNNIEFNTQTKINLSVTDIELKMEDTFEGPSVYFDIEDVDNDDVDNNDVDNDENDLENSVSSITIDFTPNVNAIETNSDNSDTKATNTIGNSLQTEDSNDFDSLLIENDENSLQSTVKIDFTPNTKAIEMIGNSLQNEDSKETESLQNKDSVINFKTNKHLGIDSDIINSNAVKVCENSLQYKVSNDPNKNNSQNKNSTNENSLQNNHSCQTALIPNVTESKTTFVLTFEINENDLQNKNSNEAKENSIQRNNEKTIDLKLNTKITESNSDCAFEINESDLQNKNSNEAEENDIQYNNYNTIDLKPNLRVLENYDWAIETIKNSLQNNNSNKNRPQNGDVNESNNSVTNTKGVETDFGCPSSEIDDSESNASIFESSPQNEDVNESMNSVTYTKGLETDFESPHSETDDSESNASKFEITLNISNEIDKIDGGLAESNDFDCKTQVMDSKNEINNIISYMKEYVKNYSIITPKSEDFVVINHEMGNIRVSLDNFNSYRFLGDTKYCQLCHMYIRSDGRTHDMTNRHISNVLKPITEQLTRTVNNISSHCIICNEVVLTLSEHHIYNEDHKKILNELLIVSQNVANDRIMCDICNFDMKSQFYEAHLKTKKHKKKSVALEIINFPYLENKTFQEFIEKIFLVFMFFDKRNSYYYCNICTREFIDLKHHYIKYSHEINEKRLVFNKKILQKRNYCYICGIIILHNLMKEHYSGKKHKQSYEKYIDSYFFFCTEDFDESVKSRIRHVLLKTELGDINDYLDILELAKEIIGVTPKNIETSAKTDENLPLNDKLVTKLDENTTASKVSFSFVQIEDIDNICRIMAEKKMLSKCHNRITDTPHTLTSSKDSANSIEVENDLVEDDTNSIQASKVDDSLKSIDQLNDFTESKNDTEILEFNDSTPVVEPENQTIQLFENNSNEKSGTSQDMDKLQANGVKNETIINVTIENKSKKECLTFSNNKNKDTRQIAEINNDLERKTKIKNDIQDKSPNHKVKDIKKCTKNYVKVDCNDQTLKNMIPHNNLDNSPQVNENGRLQNLLIDSKLTQNNVSKVNTTHNEPNNGAKLSNQSANEENGPNKNNIPKNDTKLISAEIEDVNDLINEINNNESTKKCLIDRKNVSLSQTQKTKDKKAKPSNSINISENNIFDFHKCIENQLGFYCLCCNIEIYDIMFHINTFAHINNLVNAYLKDDTDKLKNYITAGFGSDDEAYLNRRFNDNFLKANKMRDFDEISYVCDVCEKLVGKSLEFDHILSKKHRRIIVNCK